jgi:hypothetical protein
LFHDRPFASRRQVSALSRKYIASIAVSPCVYRHCARIGRVKATRRHALGRDGNHGLSLGHCHKLGRSLLARYSASVSFWRYTAATASESRGLGPTLQKTHRRSGAAGRLVPRLHHKTLCEFNSFVELRIKIICTLCPWPEGSGGGDLAIALSRTYCERRTNSVQSFLLPIVTGQRRRPHLPCPPNPGHKEREK